MTEAMITDTHLPPNWRTRLLALLNSARVLDPEVQKLLLCWAKAEGGTATWNPLNTTQPLMGSTSYNKSAVQNYTKPIYGVCATAITLVNGRYGGITGALQGGTLTALQIAEQHRDEFVTWGTSPDTLIALIESS